jgi:endoribonuclease Dicer
VTDYKPCDPEAPDQMSPKVSRLREKLVECFRKAADTKCIVFTKQRHTARLLGDLFIQLGIQNLRPGVLIGIRSADDAGMNTSFRQQFTTLVKFRTGELNCLVSFTHGSEASYPNS